MIHIKKDIKLLNSREKPYPHDYVIDRLFLWILPPSVKPNHITIFRMLATPFVFLFVIREDWLIAAPVFIIIAFTDVLDGTMARMRKEVTAWGTLFDPVADKFLVGGVLFILILKYINILIGMAIICLELLVIIGAWLKKNHGTIVSASPWGKTKMVLQVSGIAMVLLSLLLGNATIMLIAEWTLILSIGFALLSIFNRGLSL
ncbi:CDP-alcohol phosphatidyltransferase family protein [Candidatus Parcubacteria bacterium]|nr:CDP-alcohol phosphatidyltransferase family protein [Patescibacteria group bacterium]MCG2694118.1 CDP-alcohol phosphatidyltransferase family protein [Candidatus Parcubacteria bacterium]